MMLSQWECLLKNLGEWQGSFTYFSPQGEELEDTPTIVCLEVLENKAIRQIVRYLPSDQPLQEKVLEYSSLNTSILFFDNGAFSQGSLQWGPLEEFGAEFSFIEGQSRLRVIQLFNKEELGDRVDPGRSRDYLTLIREKLAGTNATPRPPLTLTQLLGEWQGKAVTIYPDLRTPDRFATHLQLHLQGDCQLSQKLTLGSGSSVRTISSVARIDGSILHFESSDFPVQILLLPDGASCNFPVQIKPGKAFFLEAGWLITPLRRQRLIRSYTSQGEWLSLTLVEEEKIS